MQKDFKDIHRKLMIDALAKEDHRLHNRQFSLDIGRGDKYLAINAYLDYYEGFFKWLLTGSDHPDSFILLSDKAQRYKMDYKGRNVAYAPRIADQLDYVVNRLKERPSSKRAMMMILEKEDRIVNEADYTIEYPCTIGYHFYIEDERLCMTTLMRSNNVCSVIGLDVFLSVSLMKLVAEKLGREPGIYTHFMSDAHIREEEIQRAKNYISMEL